MIDWVFEQIFRERVKGFEPSTYSLGSSPSSLRFWLKTLGFHRDIVEIGDDPGDVWTTQIMRKPYFDKGRNAWCVRVGTTQHNLGADKETAFRKFHALMAGQITAAPDVSAAEIIQEYLLWSENHQARSTFENYARQLNLFQEFLGAIKLKDLKPFHVARWLDRHGWTGNTANGAVRAAVRPFSWALKMGVIESNPLAKVDRPAATPRECYITQVQFKKLQDEITDEPFRDLVTILRETGCRPQEARKVEARHFRRDAQSIVFPREESKGKRRQRVIVLTPAAHTC